jgi:hypothetical protein
MLFLFLIPFLSLLGSREEKEGIGSKSKGRKERERKRFINAEK